jgi:hypothetical protein
MSEVLSSKERVDPVTPAAVASAVEQQLRTIALAARDDDRSPDWLFVRVDVTDVGGAAWVSTTVPLLAVAL